MRVGCMGMALSTAQDKVSTTNGGAGVGHKHGFVSKLRRKLPWSKSYEHHGRNRSNSAPLPATATTAATTGTTDGTPKKPNRRSVVPELPRPPTMRRQQSEHRDRLRPYQPPQHERRAASADRRSSTGGPRVSSRSLQPIPSQSITSVPSLRNSVGEDSARRTQEEVPKAEAQSPVQGEVVDDATTRAGPPSPEAVDPRQSEPRINAQSMESLSISESSDDWKSRAEVQPLIPQELEKELDWRWILNLSMHFRDESNREKFFVTYAQERNIRRRITISCDYRDADEGTLEKELSTLRYQRDKSAKIYEAIRDSLQDIIFYDTITNLKLQTSDGRLHVHVTEDLNEIIQFPPVMAIAHLRCPKYRECDLEFDSHLSGFVYKVKVNGEIFIKKEIPGPDTVDEFLYEINALYALADSENVIRFGGCVVDDRRERVKGLLISFASKGALIDILFNERGKLPWGIREKWAKQIVAGLSEIHEAGYVQGDFTLTNIVIDEQDDAKIIDINRRGCPVGWEPPEVTAMIDGLQRIGMYIGVKSDLFQLGMVLWGIAHEIDEPEVVSRPLTMDQAPDDVPEYFREIVEACLCDRPQGRLSAKEILTQFPERIDDSPHIVASSKYGSGKPLPAITQWGEPTKSESDSRTRVGGEPNGSAGRKSRTPLSEEALQGLAAYSNSTGPLTPQPDELSDFQRLSEQSPPSEVDNLQVIDACPSEFSNNDEAPLRNITGAMYNSNTPSYDGGLLVGGVDLPDSVTSENAGVPISVPSPPPPPPLPLVEDTKLQLPEPSTVETTPNITSSEREESSAYSTPAKELEDYPEIDRDHDRPGVPVVHSDTTVTSGDPKQLNGSGKNTHRYTEGLIETIPAMDINPGALSPKEEELYLRFEDAKEVQTPRDSGPVSVNTEPVAG